MQTKTKKILFWIVLFLVFIFGIATNMMIEKNLALNLALDTIAKAPLQVKMYVLLLGVLTAIVGEIMIYSYQKRDVTYPLVVAILLVAAFVYSRFYYFIILALIVVVFEMLMLWTTRHRKDAIEEVLEKVLTETNQEEKQEFKAELVEQEKDIHYEEVDYNTYQQQEVEQFIDMLFVDYKEELDFGEMMTSVVEETIDIIKEQEKTDTKSE